MIFPHADNEFPSDNQIDFLKIHLLSSFFVNKFDEDITHARNDFTDSYKAYIRKKMFQYLIGTVSCLGCYDGLKQSVFFPLEMMEKGNWTDNPAERGSVARYSISRWLSP